MHTYPHLFVLQNMGLSRLGHVFVVAHKQFHWLNLEIKITIEYSKVMKNQKSYCANQFQVNPNMNRFKEDLENPFLNSALAFTLLHARMNNSSKELFISWFKKIVSNRMVKYL